MITGDKIQAHNFVHKFIHIRTQKVAVFDDFDPSSFRFLVRSSEDAVVAIVGYKMIAYSEDTPNFIGFLNAYVGPKES